MEQILRFGQIACHNFSAKQSLGVVLLIFCLFGFQPLIAQETVCSSISSSSDDAEETPSGTLKLTSGDLELVFDNAINDNQVVGMRFLNLNIPASATIESAYIQFTCEATIDIDPSNLLISGEAHDNPETFSIGNSISDRLKTSSSVNWLPANWNVYGQSGPNEQSADISTIIQEIVNRAGYTANSSIVLMIEGIGKRTAFSFDGDPDLAPSLCVSYNTNDCNEVEISEHITEYMDNVGVLSPECLIGSPDLNFANFYHHQDNIVAKFTDVLEPGTEYTVIWKQRNYTSNDPGPSKLEIYESEDGVNFTFNTSITTSSTTQVDETVVVAAVNTMFLKLVNSSASGNGYPDFQVDAINYTGVICDESAKIGNFVWDDTDQDGIQDENELGIEGVMVYLEDEFANPITDQETKEDGSYEFNNLAAGNYVVRFEIPEGFTVTIQNQGTNDEIDSDASALDGRTDMIVLSVGDVNTTIDAGCHSVGPLPVELISFRAKLIEGNKIQLDWATESEENNNFFEIERSADGAHFQAIGSVEGNGTSSLVNLYDFIDRTPFFGKNYYRLKQVDFDGKFDFSDIESVVIDDENLPDVIVYPNPTKDLATLRVVSPFEQDASIEVLNAMGQVIESLIIKQGENSLDIDMNQHQAGFYFININYDGYKKVMHRVLKIKD